MAARALTFGSVAEAYERFRPGYPDALVDLVLSYAERPVAAALELGAGTGKATRAFAARGVEVTATDPDEAMLAELRRVLPSVRTVAATFEALPAAAEHDLVFAAAALHWTEPAGRWERVAGHLRPDGVFASFGGPFSIADPGVEAAVRAARAELLPVDDVPSPDGTPAGSPLQWPGTELVRSALFTDVRQEELGRRLRLSAAEYVGYLGTVSAYLELAAPVRRTVLDRVLGVLPAQVDVVADLTVHLARLRPSAGRPASLESGTTG